MIKKMSNLHILIVGDVILDEYIDTNVQRISPEAPVPVAHVKSRWQVAGGAANVARNLAQLGCKTTLVGVCGNDIAGNTLNEIIAKEGIQNALCLSDEVLTIQKTRVVAQNQQMLRLDHEDNKTLTRELYARLLENVEKFLPHVDAVILSDYAKGVLNFSSDGDCLAKETIKLCQCKNIPVLVDPKGIDWERYNGATCITPNTLECSVAVGLDCLEKKDLEKAASILLSKYSIQNLLVTRSAKGMALFTQALAPLYIKAKVKEVIDVSGAGDTVIAVLTACYAAGFSWADSTKLANRAAGRVVIKSGTSPITKAEFSKILDPSLHNAKLVNEDELLELVKQWRIERKKIVFTNGCFDILHKGHVQLLQDCADYGDKLIVALNTDNSVKRLKGSTRPIQDEHSRAFVLAALQCVDAVVLFDTETPYDLISSIIPDVLVKGGDYTIDSIVGSDVVIKNGGDVQIVSLVENMSTTNIVSRIKQNN